MSSRPGGLYAMAASVFFSGGFLPAQSVPPPPPSAAIPVRTVMHGVTITDPYRWLEDRSSPATAAWVHAQQRYTAEWLSSRHGMHALREQVQEVANIEAPHQVLYRNGDYFIERKAAGSQFAGIYQRHGAAGQEELLVAPSGTEAAASDTVELLNVSADGTPVALA